MAEFQDTASSDSALPDILAITTLFKFRVAKLPSGNFCVFADTFQIEDYPNEDEARALCNRLIAHQAREVTKGWRKK
jgi:hypothetical protein